MELHEGGGAGAEAGCESRSVAASYGLVAASAPYPAFGLSSRCGGGRRSDGRNADALRRGRNLQRLLGIRWDFFTFAASGCEERVEEEGNLTADADVGVLERGAEDVPASGLVHLVHCGGVML